MPGKHLLIDVLIGIAVDAKDDELELQEFVRRDSGKVNEDTAHLGPVFALQIFACDLDGYVGRFLNRIAVYARRYGGECLFRWRE